MVYTIPDCLAIPYNINTRSCILRQSSTDPFFFINVFCVGFTNFYRLPEVNRIVVSYGQRNLQKGVIHEQSLPCFCSAETGFVCCCLFVYLFVCFFYFPVVAAFSFLKIPTRVFAMKYLETTYIFFMHTGSSSNSFSLQIE